MKKEEEEKKPQVTEGRKNKTTLATHGSTMGDDYNSDDDFNVCFATVEKPLVMVEDS